MIFQIRNILSLFCSVWSNYVPEMEQQEKWILCPVCGNKTRNKIRADTVLKYFPLFCPKCKKESLIEVEELKIKIISEPSTKTQSQ